MTVKIETSENSIHASLEGELDHHSAKEIREEIDNRVSIEKPPELILDFQNVTFMDSSGIGLVMGRYRLLKTYGGELKVINTSPQITKVMKLAGLDRLAGIHERSAKK